MYQYRDGLESARLRTRFLTMEDVTTFAVFFENKDATRFLPVFEAKSNEEAAAYVIGRQLDRYSQERYGLQAMIEKTSGKFIGLCGLLTQEVDGVKELEIGYHMLSEYWGQGFAPEAAKRFMEYAFDELGSDSIISIIDVENVKSQRVAEKNGLVRERRTSWNGMDIYVYRKRRQ